MRQKLLTARRWDEFNMSAGAKTCPAVGWRPPILADYSREFVSMSKATQIKSLALEHLLCAIGRG